MSPSTPGRHCDDGSLDAPPPEPPCAAWPAVLDAPPDGEIFGHRQSAWRERTRRELGLDPTRPIVATGHQALLWHPGILAKYMLVDAYARLNDVATANLIVDQHVGSFGRIDAPIRREDGTLAVQAVDLLDARPDVPMGLHEAVAPDRPEPWSPRRRPALESVEHGLARMLEAVGRHADAPNAAWQMARALSDLMSRWVRRMPGVTATDLIGTALARRMLEAMVHDPHECIRLYNRAVQSIPEAGISTLLVHRETVELPVWRIDEQGRRRKAYSHHIESFLDGEMIRLMPRALFMTALVRLGMCDIFIHGTGGANYDRTMEQWIRQWLGVETGAAGVCTATVRLPLPRSDDDADNPGDAVARLRRSEHDPVQDPAAGGGGGGSGPSAAKQAWLDAIGRLPRRSKQRREAFYAMHDWLDQERAAHADRLKAARQNVARAHRHAAEAQIRDRRDWPFAMYPEDQIDALRGRVEAHAASVAAGRPVSV